MASLFDGVAGLMADVFGDPVQIIPLAGASYEVAGKFREQPVTISDENGHDILMVMPVLKLTKQSAEGIGRGVVVVPSGGSQFRVLNRQPGGSPATDAFVIFELEEIT